VPWFALWLLALAFISLAAARLYVVRLNPEVVFFRTAVGLKRAWARNLPADKRPRVIFAGGSSCHTSIDTSRLLQRNVRALNMGLGAGLGLKFLTRFALSEAKPGDTLILAVEPELFTSSLTDPALAVQLSRALNAPELLRDDNSPACPVRSALALRPGAHHVFMAIGKLLGGRPLDRYGIAELSPCGWHPMRAHSDFKGRSFQPGELSSDARKFLGWLRKWCATNELRLAYSMPWSYVSPEDARVSREQNRNFLLQIAAYMPVLKDPMLGAYSVREHYADTALHLDTEGAALRTDRVAQQLTNWSVWSSAELAELRFSDDGIVHQKAALASRVETVEKAGN